MKVSEGFDSHARKAGMAHSVRDSEGLGMQGRLRVQGTEWFPRWWISVSGLVDSLMYPRIDLKHRKNNNSEFGSCRPSRSKQSCKWSTLKYEAE